MAGRPPDAEELNVIRAELQARWAEAEAHSKALRYLEERFYRLEASVGISQSSASTLQLQAQPKAASPGSESESESATESWDLSAALDGADAESGAPPESYFAFCATMLTSRQEREQHRVVWQLLMYVFLLTMLAGTFFDVCKNRSMLARWGGSVGSYDAACFYQGYTDNGPETFHRMILDNLAWRKIHDSISLPFVGVGLSCMLLLALYLRNDTVTMLYQAAFAEEESLQPTRRLLVILGEVVRTIVVPVQVAAGAAMQLSQSADVADVILNTFAATFLLEMDGMLYTLALGSEEKQAYQRRWQRQSQIVRKLKQERALPNCVLAVDVIGLSALFLVPHLHRWGGHSWSTGNDYQFEFSAAIKVIMYPFGLVRTFLLQLAIMRMRAGFDCRDSLATFKTMGQRALGFVGACVTLRVGFTLLFAEDPVLDYASITSCLNGTDSSACNCDLGA